MHGKHTWFHCTLQMLKVYDLPGLSEDDQHFLVKVCTVFLRHNAIAH